MPVPIIINNRTYNYPVAGEDPGYGAEATDAFLAVVEVINTLVAPGDILTTTATLNNNVATYTDVNGLAFDSTQVRAGNIDYSIYRISTDFPSGNIESGTIYIAHDDSAIAGSKWLFSQRINGSAGVTFNITDAGQVRYISSNLDLGAGGYIGTMKFLARTLFP